MQRAMIVTTDADGSLAALNETLEAGWRVVEATPMGGAGAGRPVDAVLGWAALVVIERAEETEAAVAVLQEAEDEVDELIDEVVEGDGAGGDGAGGEPNLEDAP